MAVEICLLKPQHLEGKMTPEQLKKLAEIAGVELDKDDHSDNYILWDAFGTSYVNWVPHIAIEQAMMVAEKAFGFFQLKRVRYDGKNWVYYLRGSYKNEHGILESNGEGITPAEAICAAALAIGG